MTDRCDWNEWRSLPVQSGGRRKPLDTLARESLRLISNRASVTDPETGEKLDPTAFWLEALFDWQGWEKPQSQALSLTTNWRREYFHLHAADKWDRAPLLRIDFLELRKTLGVAPETAYVSAAHLAAAQIEDPRSEDLIPFPAWAEKLAELEAADKPLTVLEKKALELADHYWAFLYFRMGRTMEVLPLHGSETQDWMPVATLMIGAFDDTSDPSGRLRKAQQHLHQARVAYRANDPDAFSDATRSLLGTLGELGSQVGTYPTATEIALELGYNRWAPFRIAWVLMLLALLGLALHFGSQWKIFYQGAVFAYGDGDRSGVSRVDVAHCNCSPAARNEHV